mmetsp:Transcript_12299/g.19997  ORF Transcript_12299/g.19997 Transcript_12299/m.19997 type:complete len:133 (+) Transcript_12299:296-694(+)
MSVVTVQLEKLLTIAESRLHSECIAHERSKSSQRDLEQSLEKVNTQLDVVRTEKAELGRVCEEHLSRIDHLDKERCEYAERVKQLEQSLAESENERKQLQNKFSSFVKSSNNKVKRLELQIAQDQYIADRSR